MLYAWYNVTIIIEEIVLSLLQTMASELNMYESQVAEHRMDIERLQKEMQEVKKKYFLQKKKEQAQK